MPFVSTSMSRSVKALVIGTVFIDLVGFAIVLPLLPSYGSKYGGSDFAIGVLVASYSLVQLLLAPWWGRMSDRIGRRPVILIGLLGSAFSYLLFAWANTFMILLLSRVIAGATGATVNVAQASLADGSPPQRRSQVMGLIGASFGLAFIVGPALAGITSRLGDAAPGYMAAALTGANWLLALALFPETRINRAVTEQTRALDWRRLTMPFGVILFETLAFTVMYAFFTLFAERVLGYGREEIAYLFVYIGLITAVVQGGVVGWLVPRLGEIRLMVLGSLSLAIGLGSLPLTVGESPTWLIPALLTSLFFVAVGTGLVTPTVTGFVSRVTDPRDQGRALGLLQSTASTARILGPVTFGLVSGLGGVRAPFMIASLMALIALVLALRAERLVVPQERKTPDT
jgi:DHA1 family tetracycline resistance protein-like MFS transporter